MLEAALKLFAKVTLLIVGWPVGMAILKLLSLGKARRIDEARSSDEELSSAYLLFYRNEDEELLFSDIGAAWIGAVMIVLVAFWASIGFSLPWTET